MSQLDRHFATQKDKNDFYIALVVIALSIAAILWVIFPNTSSEGSLFPESVVIQTDKPSGQLETTTVLNAEGEIHSGLLATQPTEEEVEIDAALNPWLDSLRFQGIKNTALLPENVPPTLETDAIDQSSAEVVIQARRDSINAFVQRTLDSIRLSRETAVIVPPAEKVAPQEPAAIVQQDVVTTTDETPALEQRDRLCTIMIGAFADGTNAGDLIRRLKKDDYLIYTSYRKGYRTVGVQLECDPTLLETTLRKIRATYAADAFIVK